jgi:uncharacterized membrane protein
MDNIERIHIVSDTRSHWVVRGPAGKTYEWDADITEEREGELIAWASAEGADIANSGRIEFRDAGARGTVVIATITYDPPGGVVGEWWPSCSSVSQPFRPAATCAASSN